MKRLKKVFRRLLFALALLITLGALFFAEEDWRGSRAWAEYKHEMEVKGESFDSARLIPPKVPDDENLAKIPFFVTGGGNHLPFKNLNDPRRPRWWHYSLAGDLTNWAEAYGTPNADSSKAAKLVLNALREREPLLAELETNQARRSCQFSTDYENLSGNADLVLQLAQIKQFFQVLSLRAEAELVAGQTDRALDDIELMFRVNDSVREEPLLISQLVSYAITEVLLHPVAEGLAEHRWSDAQLQTLQAGLEKIDFLASMRRSFEGERDFLVNPFFNEMSFRPRGWDRMEQLNFNKAIQNTVMPRIDVAGRRIDPGVNQACNVAFSNLLEHPVLHHRFFLSMMLPAETRVCVKTAVFQTEIDEVRVACALERYRLAEGNYPATLDALIPRFANTLPRDVITGEPLKYRRINGEKFIVYSVGWNETDDGGKTVINKDGSHDNLRGDWVFEYPN